MSTWEGRMSIRAYERRRRQPEAGPIVVADFSLGYEPAIDGLRISHGRDWQGYPVHRVATGPECNNCGEPLSLAHAVFEVVAMTLAEPLRRAYHRHQDSHRGNGWGGCDECDRLCALLPDGDQPIAIA